MNEWKTYRLGEITSYISRGITPSYCDTGLTIINQKCIRNGVVDFSQVKYTDPQKKIPSDKILQDRDILINSTGTGTLGRVSIYHQIGQQCTVDSHVTIVRSSKDIDATFLGYNLINQQYNIESLATGSTGQTELPRARLASEIEILLPPLDEQRRIAGILGSLDDKIELNRRINANLEAQAQALFRSWFVDFEPFRDGPFVDSELGKIPQGWKVGNLLDIAELFDYKRKPLSSREREKMQKIYPYYGATSIMDFVDNYIFDGIYLLMGEDGSVANAHGYPYLQYVFGKFWPNNHAHVMQGKNGYTTEMLHCLLLKKNITSIVTGAVQPKISQANMKKILVPLPPDKVCSAFADLINPIYSTRRNSEKENLNLSALRDTLLPKLMTGEITIE